jgi:hypothetical protein
MLLAAAAVLAGEHEPVYQLGSSDVNRISGKRLTELTGLAVRQVHRDKADRGEDKLRSRLRARLESGPVSYEYFERWSAPMFKRIAERLIETIDDKLPRWGAPRLEAFAERARELASLDVHRASRRAGRSVQGSRPTTTSRSGATTCALWARVTTPADQDRCC